jgi:YD repeat-containing protein
LEINDDAKELVQEIGEAINGAVERSPEVADAISRLRAAGYEMELTLKLEIGLRETGAEDEDGETTTTTHDAQDTTLELTDEDRRTLRSMKIRFDESE